MRLERYIYLDAVGIASLYSQLRGEDVVETLFSMEHSRASGLKAALTAFIGAGVESTKVTKEATARKISQRPENMLREVSASLHAHGTLNRSIQEAISSTTATGQPAWCEMRHPFSMPFQIAECNEMGTAVFLCGFTPLHLPIDSVPKMKIRMSAGLQHFPGARDGVLGISGHDAMFFRSLGGAEYPFVVFGSLFRAGADFQIKPYAIHL